MGVLSRVSEKMFVGLQYVLPQHGISSLIGRLAASKHPKISQMFIQAFAKHYQIDMSIAKHPDLASYPSFNAFFTRELKEGVRPIEHQNGQIVCPADGAISQMGKIENGQIFQAKGQTYDVAQLLGDTKLAQQFAQGFFSTIYLSPRDYHRVHMPYDGDLILTRYIPGQLFSVNVVTSEQVPALFARNERLVCVFDTDLGKMVVVLVGAMIVAGIETVVTGAIKGKKTVFEQTWQRSFKKGEELGRFYLGSTAIVLMENEFVRQTGTHFAGDSVMLGQAIANISNAINDEVSG